MPVEPEFFAFDTETTGVDPAKHQIISIGMILLAPDLSPVDEKIIHALPDAYGEIDPRAVEVNGYNYADWVAKGAVTQQEMFDEIEYFLRRRRRLKQIGHNLKFDAAFLEKLFQRFENHARHAYREYFSFFGLDTLMLSMFTDMVFHNRMRTSYKLERLSQSYGIQHTEAHTALSDIRATVALLKAMRDALRRTNKVEAPSLTALPNAIITCLDKDKDIWLFAAGKHTGKFTHVVADEELKYLHFVLRFPDLSEEQRNHLNRIVLEKTENVR